MIVHHYYPQRLNIGDSFIRDGIARLLGERAPGSEILHFPVNKPRREGPPFGLMGPNLDRSNAEADLVVIGGSNLYEPRRSGRWSVTTDADSIRRLRPPVLLIGMGGGSRLGSLKSPYSPESIDEIRLLNERAIGSSVRDGMTLDLLASLGVRGAVLTGCPAVFLFDRPFAFNGRRRVIISYPPVRYRKRRLLHHRLVSATRKYIRHCRSLGFEPVLACHTEEDRDAPGPFERERIEVFYSEKTGDYYDLYREARWVIGFRLHAAILSLSLGIPFIPIGFDHRALGFARTFRSEGWLIDATRFGLYRSLLERTERILAEDRSAFEGFLSVRDELRPAMRGFLEKSLGRIGPGAPGSIP